MGRYQDVMRHLHPKVIIEKVELPHDTARGKYSLNSSIAHSYLEFENIMINYLTHHMNEVFGNSLPPDFLLAKAKKFLEPIGGFKNAVYIGLSGTNGGMINILNNLSDGFKNEAKKAYFDYVIDAFIDPLSFQEVVEVMRELKDKISNYSPQSFAYIEPEAMAANYEEILWSYIESLSKYKNLWTY